MSQFINLTFTPDSKQIIGQLKIRRVNAQSNSGCNIGSLQSTSYANCDDSGDYSSDCRKLRYNHTRDADVDGDRFHFFSLLPVFFIFILFRLGRVSNLNLEVKEQRTLPLLFAIGAACIGLGIFYVMDSPREIIWAGVAYIVNGVIFGAITQVWKISFHAGVYTGCVTVLVLILHDARFAWFFLLVPLIAWARVRRKRHTLVQTVVGALIALINTVVVLRLCVGIGLGS